VSHVFIAYSREEADELRDMRSWIEGEGFKVWTDEDLRRTDRRWERTIRRAIDEACCLVVLWSPTACNSHWVTGEPEYAVLIGVPVLCVLIKGKRRNAVPLDWLRANLIDLRNKRPGRWGSAASQALIQEIRNNCRPEPSPQAQDVEG